MPVEVFAGDYLFNDFDNASTTPFITYITGDQPANPKIPWAYNHLHDLESLWWVTVWIFSFNFHRSDDIPTLGKAEECLETAQKLFPPSGHVNCINAFNSTFYEIAKNLPQSVQYIITPLDELRRRLKRRYFMVESKSPVNSDDLDYELYDNFEVLFDGYAKFAQNENLVSLLSVYNELVMKSLKREREERAGCPSSKRRAVSQYAV